MPEVTVPEVAVPELPDVAAPVEPIPLVVPPLPAPLLLPEPPPFDVFDEQPASLSAREVPHRPGANKAKRNQSMENRMHHGCV